MQVALEGAVGFATWLFSSSMPAYVWIIRALSPRDGGWVRVLWPLPDARHSPREDMCWTMICFFWDMMVMAGDYVTVDVKRTIAFTTRSKRQAEDTREGTGARKRVRKD